MRALLYVCLLATAAFLVPAAAADGPANSSIPDPFCALGVEHPNHEHNYELVCVSVSQGKVCLIEVDDVPC